MTQAHPRSTPAPRNSRPAAASPLPVGKLPARRPSKEEMFCMRCGSPLAPRHLHGRLRPFCAACGWIHFKNPSSASAAVILLEGALVLVKRSVPPHRGSWCLPAGFQEYDEGPEEAAVREAKEETGLDIRLTGLHRVFFSAAYPGKNTVVHIYMAEAVGGELAAGDDASDARAFPLDRLPRRIAFRSHVETIWEIRERKTVRGKRKKG